MKPWLNTTEDVIVKAFHCPCGHSFNEAVAQHHGGQHPPVPISFQQSAASMKPWLNTTEDSSSVLQHCCFPSLLQ